ncbi:MAG: hypothetical protein ACREXJ_04410 [Gammaproteobacteria bacterium]
MPVDQLGQRGEQVVSSVGERGLRVGGAGAHWCTILVSVAVRLLMHPRCRWVIALLA